MLLISLLVAGFLLSAGMCSDRMIGPDVVSPSGRYVATVRQFGCGSTTTTTTTAVLIDRDTWPALFSRDRASLMDLKGGAFLRAFVWLEPGRLEVVHSREGSPPSDLEWHGVRVTFRFEQGD